MRLVVLSLLVVVAASPVLGADPKPEIDRPAATPQRVGTAHTLRLTPEACTRIEGLFTGQAAEPYRFTVVRTSNCQPTRPLRRRRQGQALGAGGLEVQRPDPRAQRRLPAAAGRGAGGAHACRCWPEA